MPMRGAALCCGEAMSRAAMLCDVTCCDVCGMSCDVTVLSPMSSDDAPRQY